VIAKKEKKERKKGHQFIFFIFFTRSAPPHCKFLDPRLTRVYPWALG
jgi:hypothetical protein